MQARSLHPGDRVIVDRKGFVFEATVVSAKPGGYVRLTDPKPRSITWQFVSPRYVKRKLGVA